MGLTLSRGISGSRSGSPDTPCDKVSPKNKMPNILYILWILLKIIAFFIITFIIPLFARLYVMVCIILTC